MAVVPYLQITEVMAAVLPVALVSTVLVTVEVVQHFLLVVLEAHHGPERLQGDHLVDIYSVEKVEFG